ncbi:TonB-dependent receptor [Marinimicrobium sp. ARAG 43.8]|uniref:TonB-dependent receptor n=1 Tax=Marinimicrobium sp. ARAG 43.8 TaxID=3418719 RepID=UPI003CEF8144
MFNKRMLSLAVSLVAGGSFPLIAQAQNESNDNAPLEEIVVQGVRAAELNAREIERNKDVFSSVISQDDAGNFADQNVAEALQRLPGVTIQKNDGQGEFVNIRGMGAGFVGVSMNNSEMASASGDGRAVGLNTIPADLMGSIEVFKSLTPDMDLNSIAGRVNVNSVTAFSRGEDSLRLTLQGAMHEQRGEFSPKATLIGTKLFADDTIGLAVSLSHEERGTEVNQITNEDGLRYIRPARPGVGPSSDYDGNEYSSRDYADNYFYNFEGEDTLGADPYLQQPRMLTPNNFEVRQDESVRTRNAATVDLGWRPSSDHEFSLRVAHTDYTDEELTLREYYNFGAGDERYISYVNPDFEPYASVGLPYEGLFAVGNADLQHRIYIQEAKDKNTTITFNGKHTFADSWHVDYEFHTSDSERTNPDDRRIQFRQRYLPMVGQLDKENLIAQIISSSQLGFLADSQDTVYPESGIPGTNGYSGQRPYVLGDRYQPGMDYDNLYLEDGLREDELQQVELNLEKEFFGGWLNYIKGGVMLKERDRNRERVALNVNPTDYPDGCEGDRDCLNWANTSIGLADFDTYTPRNDRFDHDFVTVGQAETVIAATRRIPEWLDPLRSGAASNSQNYRLFEDTQEAYLMAEFQITDNATLITGARYVNTEYGSTGYLTLRHDRFQEDEGFVRDIVMPLTDPNGGEFVTNEYDGIYPGAHLRWDVTDNLLARASIWTSYTRPSFGQAAARAEFSDRVKLCRATPLNEGTSNERDRCSDNIKGELGIQPVLGDDGFVRQISEELSLAPGGNALDLGNTDLVAMEATNFDASLSWYGPNGHFFEAAVFYKDISDYVVDVRGLSMTSDQMPQNVQNALNQLDSSDGGLPTYDNFTQNLFQIGDDFVFHNVNTTINGDKAKVYGLELSYSKFFENGLFLNSNLTLLDSEADAGDTVRAEKTAMPNQADLTANLTLGWENEYFSARLIGNFRSEILTQIGTCSQADINRDTEWARVNMAGAEGALSGASGDGTIYHEYCQRWADVFQDDVAGLDLKMTYNLTPDVKFYLDVLNVTEHEDVFFYRGDTFSNGNEAVEKRFPEIAPS